MGVDTKRPLTLMDLATISMKELRKRGYLMIWKYLKKSMPAQFV